MRSRNPASFKWRHFQGELILQGVRWYYKYGISYRDLEERFLKKLIKGNPTCDIAVINTDKNPAYGQAINVYKSSPRCVFIEQNHERRESLAIILAPMV